MSRRRTTVKHLVELYLLIIGGAYTLAGTVELIVNTPIAIESSDSQRPWIDDVKETLLLLIPAALILAAGIGVHKYQRWGLFLTAGMGIATFSYGLSWEFNHQGDFDGHNFTIVLPMTLILIWALLPSTWLEFKRKGLVTS